MFPSQSDFPNYKFASLWVIFSRTLFVIVADVCLFTKCDDIVQYVSGVVLGKRL